jgi:sirohydrochlorin ferrochelatase
MPLRKIHFTGKKSGTVRQIDAATAQAILADGRGWNNKDRNSFYDALSDDQLLERLGNWSPVVRERAAMALGRRKSVPVAALIEMLSAPTLEARYGACQGLIHLRGQAAPAVEALQTILAHDDLWLRIKAAEALASIGKPALPALPDILDRIARAPGEDDPRAMEQRYLCSAVFEKMLTDAKKLEGVDREQLRVAIARGLQNQDGHARGQVSRIYSRLTFEEIEPLLPAIREAIVKPAPSGEMFADEVRLAGLKLLSAHCVEDGVPAIADYVLTQNPWASQERIMQILPLFDSYGAHAQTALPKLREAAEYFEQREPDFPKKLSLQKAAAVRATIAKIEAATERPELKQLK